MYISKMNKFINSKNSERNATQYVGSTKELLIENIKENNLFFQGRKNAIPERTLDYFLFQIAVAIQREPSITYGTYSI